MKELSILELLNNINERYYEGVQVHIKDQENPLYVTRVVSNASRFNFSLTCRDFEGNFFKTVSLIKDGEKTDTVEKITVTYKDGFHLEYDLASMPILASDDCVTLESVTLSLLEEKRLDEEFSEYRSLRKSLAPPVESVDTVDSVEEVSKDPEEENPKETTVVPCVTYQINTKLDPTVNVNSIRESCLTWEDANREYSRVRTERTATRFRTRLLIYELENNLRLKDVQWSEVKPLPRSKKKSFQEATVIVSGEELVIRRVFWNEEINL